MPKIIDGNVTFNSNNDYSDVEEIKGYLDCRDSVGKIKSKYTVQEIIDLTKGQYGHDVYSKFFLT